MILPDVNLLVYAYNADAPFHASAKAWWERLLSEMRPVGIAWVVMLGFVRLMSSPRVLLEPMSPAEAAAHVRTWLARPATVIVTPGPTHLDVLEALLAGPSVGSRLVTAVHLAALAIEHQAELHSNDGDFARFPGLRWHNPVT